MICPHCKKNFRHSKKPAIHILAPGGVEPLCRYKGTWHFLEFAKTKGEATCTFCLKEEMRFKPPVYLNASPALYAKSPPSKN